MILPPAYNWPRKERSDEMLKVNLVAWLRRYQKEICMVCQGSGVVDKYNPCEPCDGKGVVPK